MKTLKMVAQQIVAASVDMDYIAECNHHTLADVYDSEYGNWNGTSPKACMGYLQGLPTVCTVPFYNWEILEKLEAAGIKIPTNDDKACDLVEKYWKECGQAFCGLLFK